MPNNYLYVMDNEKNIFNLLKEQDDFDWARDIRVGNPITIGEMCGEEHQVFLGDKVAFIDGDDHYVFTIEKVRESDGWVWGNDLPPYGPGKNYHNPIYLTLYIENIKEQDDFDWARDVPGPIQLPKKFNYYIDMCGSGYSVEDLREKFIELFGSDYSTRDKFTKCNWFGNKLLRRSERKNDGVILLFSSSRNHDVFGGWNGCDTADEYEGSHRVSLTPEEFLSLQKPDNINESDDLEWIRDSEPRYIEDFTEVNVDGLRYRQKVTLGIHDSSHWDVWPKNSEYSRAMVLGFDEQSSSYEVVVDKEHYGVRMTKEVFIPKKDLEDLNRNSVNESEDDFTWADEVTPNQPYVGMRFSGPSSNPDAISTVTDIDTHMVTFRSDSGRTSRRPYKDFINRLDRGLFTLIGGSNKNINESEDDGFDWVRDEVEPIPLPSEYDYIIDMCDTTYTIDSLRSQVIELFGSDFSEQKSILNWFENSNITENESRNQGYILWLRTTNGRAEGINGQWDLCESMDEFRDSLVISPEYFLRLYKPESITESEEDDFAWTKEIEPDTDLEIGQLFHKYDVGKDTEPYFSKMLNNLLDDITFKDGKVLMEVQSYDQLLILFSETDNSQYGYVNRWLAEQVLGDDNDFWEPYSDVVYDWADQVWSIVEKDEQLLKLVVDYISENHLLVDVYYEDEEQLLDEKLLNHLHLKDSTQLGHLIYDDDEFEDLKLELTWAYTDSYNVAARDEIYDSAHDSIESLLGKSEWTSYVVEKMGGPVTRHVLMFNVTNVFWSVLREHFDTCWSECSRWSSKDDVLENIEDCEDCWYVPSDEFLDIIETHLEDNDDYLNPRYQDYPDDDKIEEYFKEDVMSRI